jgi:SAM-dependent methyltransferase
MMRNPHFDDDRIVWSDEYSGQFEPPSTGYDAEFELQWKIALEQDREFFVAPGASTDDRYIDDRIYEWTGKHPTRNDFFDPTMGSRVLDHPLQPELIRGKRCADVGCGLGRWTRVMQRLGAADVLSIDLSESALKSVSRFNGNVLGANVMRLREDHPELCGKFDFVNLWGVAMCTHDPSAAFQSAASLVGEHGAMYLMVYCPEGMHNMPINNLRRKIFHRLPSVKERLAFVDAVHHRRWNRAYPLSRNLKDRVLNLMGEPKGGKIAILDMLEPFYNWVIPLDVIKGWMKKAGFTQVTLLNEFESEKCAYHVLGRKA